MPERRRELGKMSKEEVYDIAKNYYEWITTSFPVDSFTKGKLIDMVVEFEFK